MWQSARQLLGRLSTAVRRSDHVLIESGHKLAVRLRAPVLRGRQSSVVFHARFTCRFVYVFVEVFAFISLLFRCYVVSLFADRCFFVISWICRYFVVFVFVCSLICCRFVRY